MELEKAKEYIKEKHKNQKRKQGTPYYLHPLEVSIILKEKGLSETYQIVGLFHDLIEDTETTYEEILELTDEEIYNRAFEKEESIEETVMKDIEKEKMQQALKNLTEVQQRRIELHIVNNITIRDIAQLEKVRKKQIEKSLQIGLKKIKKIFEK